MSPNRSIDYDPDSPTMARLTEYPRRRYYAMQASMWVLLACSVGVAALVDWDIRRSGANELTHEVELDSVSVKVPKGWRVSEVMSVASSSTVAVVEPTRSMTGRRITITEETPGRSENANRRRGQPIRMGDDGSGLLSVTRTELPDVMAADAAQLHIVARGSLGGGPMITIILDALQSEGRPSLEQSVELVKRIAASAKPILADKGPTIGPK